MLTGKTVLITGGSSGIGKEIARLLSQQSARVLLMARSEEKLNAVLQELSNQQLDHKAFVADITDHDQLEQCMGELTPVDGFVSCAGVNEFVPVKFINYAKLENIFSVNYFAPMIIVQKLVKKKLLKPGSSLVFISSLSSLMGVPATTIYTGSKAALNASVRVLASELAGLKARANVICPGIVRTPMIASSNIDEGQFLEQERKYPLGLGEPADVANAVLFHLWDGSRWLTGNVMTLDGGFSLQ